VTTSFARSNLAEVAGTPFLRSFSIFMPCVNVSLISSSRGISRGESVAGEGAVSGRAGSSGRVQDCWKREAASRGVDRRRVVTSSVFFSISWWRACTRASNSASNNSMSALITNMESIPSFSFDDDRDGCIPFISRDELAMSNVRDTNCYQL